jgi:hypothetical protein
LILPAGLVLATGQGEKKEGEKLDFDDIPVHIREQVYMDIGHASMCWDKPEGAGVFHSEEAAEVARSLCQFIIEEIKEAKK